METFLRPGSIIIVIRAFFVFLLFTQTLQAQVLSLLKFTATASGPRVTLLQWQVDAQQQASAYEVQRSMNGLDFTDIATLSTVRDKTNYSFIDADAGSGNIFYRLKWLQDNNNPDYSIQLVVNHLSVTGRVSLRPSVIDHGSTVLFLESSSQTDMDLRITDAAGRLCRRQTISINQGDNKLPLDMSFFAGGLYYVNVRLKNGFHQAVELVKL